MLFWAVFGGAASSVVLWDPLSAPGGAFAAEAVVAMLTLSRIG